MYKGKTVLAIIPARAGSKGIPGKNMVTVCGKPLIDFTIEAARAASCIDEILISTDSETIWAHATQLGCISYGLRPVELASDTATTIEAVVHEKNQIVAAGKSFDLCLLLQPTQPLRQWWHIAEAVAFFVDNHKQSLVSVTETRINPFLIRTIVEGDLCPVLPRNSTVRRQDLGRFYTVNGMIYINWFRDLTPELSFNDNIYPYCIAERYFVDIDEPEDLRVFEQKYREVMATKE